VEVVVVSAIVVVVEAAFVVVVAAMLVAVIEVVGPSLDAVQAAASTTSTTRAVRFTAVPSTTDSLRPIPTGSGPGR
jgi:hypothetical protein